MSKRYNLQHVMTSLLISSVRLACLWLRSDTALQRKKLIQYHRKNDHEKRERHGAISQSDAHISMLSCVNKKTDRYTERVKK